MSARDEVEFQARMSAGWWKERYRRSESERVSAENARALLVNDRDEARGQYAAAQARALAILGERDALIARAEAAEADIASLLAVVRKMTGEGYSFRDVEHAQRLVQIEHPGAALLEELKVLRELQVAARSLAREAQARAQKAGDAELMASVDSVLMRCGHV